MCKSGGGGGGGVAKCGVCVDGLKCEVEEVTEAYSSGGVYEWGEGLKGVSKVKEVRKNGKC